MARRAVGMRMWLSLPSDLRRQVEARAKCSGRTVEAQYGRAFSLGLLVRLAEGLAPLFPELTTPSPGPASPGPARARHARARR